MRFPQSEKMEIINLVEQSPIGVKRTLKELQINRSTFYRWYADYLKGGYDGLAPKRRETKHYWNQIPDQVRDKIAEVALEHPEKSSREVAAYYTEHYRYYASESSVYRICRYSN